MGLLEDKCHFFQCVKRLRVPTQFPKFEHEVHAHTSTKVPHYRICCLYDREVKPCHLLLTWDGIMILIPKAIYNLHLIYETGWLVIITLFFVGPCCELTFLKWLYCISLVVYIWDLLNKIWKHKNFNFPFPIWHIHSSGFTNKHHKITCFLISLNKSLLKQYI